MVRLYNFMHAIRSPSRRHAQGSMQLCIRRNPNMAAHSIFSESLYGHAVLIRSCFSGFIISLLHKRRKGIAIFNIDSHVWISPLQVRSCMLPCACRLDGLLIACMKLYNLTIVNCQINICKCIFPQSS